MEPTGKRTLQVNVKMSAEDFALLQRAADTIWPAVLSNSGIIPGLAKIAAKEVLAKSHKRERK